MINFKLKTVIILIVVTFVTMQSCKKKELVDIENEILTEKPTYMEFYEKSLFSEALKSENLSLIPTDFVSMYDIYLKIEETDDEAERNRLIEKYRDILKIDEDGIIELIIVDDVFASFLSPKGIVKVGNEICLVKEDKIVTLTDGDVSKIDLLNQFEEDSPENNIRVDEFIQVVQTDKAYWSGTEYWSSKYKMKWKKWASYSPFNSSVGGKIRSYYKSRWRWRTRRTNLYLHVKWDYIEWGNGGTSFISENGHIYDSKYGWSLSERRYVGSDWTPNPVYGLKIYGSVGGHSFNK